MRRFERALARDAVADLSAENLDAVAAAVRALWEERCAERLLPAPEDLSGSCKFSSMLVSAVFGLRMRGNEDHQFCVTRSGEVIDLNAGARDVSIIRDPHRHDPLFWGSRDHVIGLMSCVPRVLRWADVAMAEISRRSEPPSP